MSLKRSHSFRFPNHKPASTSVLPSKWQTLTWTLKPFFKPGFHGTLLFLEKKQQKQKPAFRQTLWCNAALHPYKFVHFLAPLFRVGLLSWDQYATVRRLHSRKIKLMYLHYRKLQTKIHFVSRTVSVRLYLTFFNFFKCHSSKRRNSADHTRKHTKSNELKFTRSSPRCTQVALVLYGSHKIRTVNWTAFSQLSATLRSWHCSFHIFKCRWAQAI
jgi:hypothetical protein